LVIGEDGDVGQYGFVVVIEVGGFDGD